MANLLYLVHRLPYPPNKGDKVRSYHVLKHLAQRHRVFLGTFVDDPDDWAHVDRVRGLCAELKAVPLVPWRAKLASLAGLVTGRALTLHYYRDAALTRWVSDVAGRERIDAVVVFSSSMAQYAQACPTLPMLVDFVDVDSAKWRDYAPQHRWPMSWLYRREGERLLAYEREVARQAERSFFVTDKESAMFRSMAPESASRVETLCNGVDAEHFAPRADCASPFAADELPIVFTGAMDYWPNVDAVSWFVQSMLPALRREWPRARFYIVGRSPTPAVQQLVAADVVVTGTVPDVRPYLQHAAVVVAPLRLARGIQNKVLEAMAMAGPVVASSECTGALEALVGDEVLAATTAEDFVTQIDGLLRRTDDARRIGGAARARVQATYSWPAHLAALERHLGLALSTPPVAAQAALEVPA